MDLDLGRWICIRCLSGPLKRRLTFLCCSISLHPKRSMGDSELNNQCQSNGYRRIRGQETLYEICAAVCATIRVLYSSNSTPVHAL